MENANQIVKNLQLQPHPEGGYYKETYRSPQNTETENGSRSLYTSIYFLLEEKNFSAFHRIKTDEMWYFHKGQGITIYILHPDNQHLQVVRLGYESDEKVEYQTLVPANVWFASRVESENGYALVSCVVVPGFDFSDFDLADRKELTNQFPQHETIIKELTR